MDDRDLKNRFTYHAPKMVGPWTQPIRYEEIRLQALLFAELLNKYCPESREKSLAVTHIEEAVFWGNAAIARNE